MQNDKVVFHNIYNRRSKTTTGRRKELEGPAEPEGEGSTKELGGEDTENSWKETKENRRSSLEEDGVREAESESDGVQTDISRNSPNP